MNKKIPIGKRAYNIAIEPVIAQGLSFSDDELDTALKDKVVGILWDDAGHSQIQDYLRDVATTEFASDGLEEALNTSPSIKDWQIGEALAEVYLTDHRNCEFPWPHSRDLRNPNASPAGADLVGFQHQGGTVRFAFGEVKTSQEERCPPQVVTGRHSLINQLEDLRDQREKRNHLALFYFAFRAPNSSWEATYKLATARYLNNSSDISLFGILVRDVTPNRKDIETRTARLANGCPPDTSIELFAFYFPKGAISTLVSRTTRIRGNRR